MGFAHKFGGVFAAVSLIATTPAAAGGLDDAEKVKRLDIMLMVSSLRCRNGTDDFRPEYQRFSARHLGTLNDAHRTMKADYVRKHGAKGGNRALDRVSTGMANRYGRGHPWMDCAELKQVAGQLADSAESSELKAAAEELLADRRVAGRFALAAHK